MDESYVITNQKTQIPLRFRQVLHDLHIPLTTSLKFVSMKDGTYNTIFNSQTGFFVRFGKTTAHADDPLFSPIGPEILDLEISTICHGIRNQPCSWCYKNNQGQGENMTFDRFKAIFHKMPRNVSQIAFGIGDIDANPNIWAIFDYCRNNTDNYVIPNVTINGWNLTNGFAEKLANVCGAVAVSHYDDDICFDAVKKLSDRGMIQTNIHQLVCEETFSQCLHVIDAQLSDPRLSHMNAIVFLSLKQKGRGTKYHPLTAAHYREMINYLFQKNARFGMDSCSAPKFLEIIKDRADFDQFQTLVEPCESTLFSSYINVKGEFFPCSFAENNCEGWKEEDGGGLDVVGSTDFLHDIWFHPKTIAFRERLIQTVKKNQIGCHSCPLFVI